MGKQNKDARKILLGIVLGGILGGSLFYLLSSSRKANLRELLEDNKAENQKNFRKKERIMNEHSGRNFLLGAMIGSSLGALTALMFTTEKGQKIKKDLIKKYPELRQMIHAFAHHPDKTIKAAAKKMKKRAASRGKKKR